MRGEDIIIAPVLSEKTTLLKEKAVYVFKVHRKANKFQIKRAVKDLFSVTVLSCNTSVIKGKPKRIRYQKGYTSTWKKAVVFLKPGETIQMFEGV